MVLTATVGTQILVAQRVGNDDESDARRMVANGVAPAGVLAVAAMFAATTVVYGFAIGGLDLGVYAIFWAVTGSNVVTAVGVGGFYLLRYERMFSNAAEEAAGSTAD